MAMAPMTNATAMIANVTNRMKTSAGSPSKIHIDTIHCPRNLLTLSMVTPRSARTKAVAT